MSKLFEYYILKILLYFAFYYTSMERDALDRMNKNINIGYDRHENYDYED